MDFESKTIRKSHFKYMLNLCLFLVSHIHNLILGFNVSNSSFIFKRKQNKRLRIRNSYLILELIIWRVDIINNNNQGKGGGRS